MNFIIDSKLIFSDERKYRIGRHLLFWLFWVVYFGLVREFHPKYFRGTEPFPNFFQSLAQSFLQLLPQVVFVYPLLYFVLPRYIFTGKYVQAMFWAVALFSLMVFANAILLVAIPWRRVMFIPQSIEIFKGVSSVWMKIKLAYLSALQGSLAGAALAISFKLFKYFYLKSQRIMQLQKENVMSQLQILKAQVHPHFLFNTLNNIYLQTQTESPKGSKMIMGLSGILRYILYEGQKPMVSLKQELQMIREYINLEKIRYGNKLDVQVVMPDKTDDIYVAPLVILPFVENCFKHGTSNMLQNPWIKLNVDLNNTTLVMKLTNVKPPLKQNVNAKPGIGIANVRQRLELLYGGKYNLQIKQEDDVFVVDLEIELMRINSQQSTNIPMQQNTEITYA